MRQLAHGVERVLEVRLPAHEVRLPVHSQILSLNVCVCVCSNPTRIEKELTKLITLALHIVVDEANRRRTFVELAEVSTPTCGADKTWKSVLDKHKVQRNRTNKPAGLITICSQPKPSHDEEYGSQYGRR